MLITISPVVSPKICEPPYLLKIFDILKNHFDDDYHFIIARVNTVEEIRIFKELILPEKRNILFLLSDEFGIIPPFLEDLYLVFRTYSNKELYDNNKIFAIPCGYSCGYAGIYDHPDWIYDMEKPKKPLINREIDIFYSGQISTSRLDCISNINRIKDNFNCVINVTNGFAKGFKIDEYYELMQNSKIALVPEGVVVPESFRYFEAFESNCIVLTTFPRHIDKFNTWFYENSPAIFLSNWSEMTHEKIIELLTADNLNRYDKLNLDYFDRYISTTGVAQYIKNIIDINDGKNNGR